MQQPVLTPCSLVELKNLLLAHGGQSVEFPHIEDDLLKLCWRGQLFAGPRTLRLNSTGKSSHREAAAAWQKNIQLNICTGYALDDDGVWRQWSWCLAKTSKGKPSRLIELIRLHKTYFGFQLGDTEMIEFCRNND